MAANYSKFPGSTPLGLCRHAAPVAHVGMPCGCSFVFLQARIVARDTVCMSDDHLANRRRVSAESIKRERKNLWSTGRAGLDQMAHFPLALFGGIISAGYLPIAYRSTDANHDVSLVVVDWWDYEVPAQQGGSGSVDRLRRLHAIL